jgi:hypothetical protein
MMEVAPEHADEFNRWYNEGHLPQRLEIPGCVSACRFRLEQGVPTYLCIWELEDDSPLHSEAYRAQQRRPSELRDRVYTHIKQRVRGLYTQIYPLAPRATAGRGLLRSHATRARPVQVLARASCSSTAGARGAERGSSV